MVFWFHGYAAHINGPTLLDFTKGMAAKGYAVVALDQHGHGYRYGTIRPPHIRLVLCCVLSGCCLGVNMRIASLLRVDKAT